MTTRVEEVRWQGFLGINLANAAEKASTCEVRPSLSSAVVPSCQHAPTPPHESVTSKRHSLHAHRARRLRASELHDTTHLVAPACRP